MLTALSEMWSSAVSIMEVKLEKSISRTCPYFAFIEYTCLRNIEGFIFKQICYTYNNRMVSKLMNDFYDGDMNSIISLHEDILERRRSLISEIVGISFLLVRSVNLECSVFYIIVQVLFHLSLYTTDTIIPHDVGSLLVATLISIVHSFKLTSAFVNHKGNGMDD